MRRDHWQHRGRLCAAALAAALVAFGLPTAAEAQGASGTALGGEKALVTVYSGGVDFLPEVDFKKAVLTVSGKGRTYRQELDAGDRLSIGMFDPEGNLLPDGVYTWELKFVPTDEVAHELRAEAARNPGKRLEAWQAQSGSFAIRDGTVADPGLAEPRPVRARARGMTADLALPSAPPAAARRGSAEDSDDAVGLTVEFEASLRAAGAMAPAPVAIPRRAGEAGFERSDSATLAFGASLEPAVAPERMEPPALGLAAPSARSSASEDRANGRDRSAQDQ